VLHRDLKPGNILMDAQGQPHLADFGVAKVLAREASGLTGSGGMVGTPNYMSPELAAGQAKHASTASDIYSLGCVLYELLTGQPPFCAGTPVETLRLVMEQPPKPPTTLNPHIDRDLATVCLKCLEKDPLRRYRSAEALADDLERWLGGFPILARPVTAFEKLWRWCGRNPALAAADALIALLVVALTVGAILVALRIADDKRLLRDNILQNLDKTWKDPGDFIFRIRSEERRVLQGRSMVPQRTTPGLPRLDFGVYVREQPVRMLTNFSPILAFLETKLAVRIDLSIYKGYSNCVQALVTGSLQLAQPGPASYVLARRMNSNVVLVARQLHKGLPVIHGVIFTRADTGITNIDQFRGRSFAFGDPNSTFGNFLAKVALLEAGLTAKDLANCCTHQEGHDAVIEAVIRRRFDGGVANANYVARANQGGTNLVVLKRLQSVSFPWVAGPGLSPALFRQLQDTLLNLKDPMILTNLSSDLTGFDKASHDDYKELERQMDQAVRFGE